MPKWIPVVVVILLLLAALYFTNPSLEMYAAWLTGEAITRIDDPETLAYLTRGGVQAITRESDAKSYYFFTIFTTNVDRVKVRAIGALGLLIPIEISGV